MTQIFCNLLATLIFASNSGALAGQPMPRTLALVMLLRDKKIVWGHQLPASCDTEHRLISRYKEATVEVIEILSIEVDL
jgi:hypothetical protein